MYGSEYLQLSHWETFCRLQMVPTDDQILNQRMWCYLYSCGVIVLTIFISTAPEITQVLDSIAWGGLLCSWVKAKVDKWAWLTGRPDLGWDEDFSRKSLSLSSLCSSSFLCFSSVLDKEPFGLKVLAKSKINCSDIKGAFDSSKDK